MSDRQPRSALRRAANPARVLDWEPNHDPASRGYGIAEVVEEPADHDIMWRPGRVLDQGREGACAGMAATGLVGAEPVPFDGISSSMGVQWYKLAQRVDEWPGDHYSGTSVNATMKVGRSLGWWPEWRWSFGADDRRRAIRVGPFLVGVPWHAGMYETDPEGVVVVRGQQVGGHCLVVVGWTTDYAGHGPGYWWRNSWGPAYGNGGSAFVPEATLDSLLEGVGECAVPIDRHRGRTPEEALAE